MYIYDNKYIYICIVIYIYISNPLRLSKPGWVIAHCFHDYMYI